MTIRNCAWECKGEPRAKKAIWARGSIVTTQCPKSLITAQSRQLLEIHRLWKVLRNGCMLPLDAKTMDALELLETESRTEEEHVN